MVKSDSKKVVAAPTATKGPELRSLVNIKLTNFGLKLPIQALSLFGIEIEETDEKFIKIPVDGNIEIQTTKSIAEFIKTIIESKAGIAQNTEYILQSMSDIVEKIDANTVLDIYARLIEKQAMDSAHRSIQKIPEGSEPDDIEEEEEEEKEKEEEEEDDEEKEEEKEESGFDNEEDKEDSEK